MKKQEKNVDVPRMCGHGLLQNEPSHTFFSGLSSLTAHGIPPSFSTDCYLRIINKALYSQNNYTQWLMKIWKRAPLIERALIAYLNILLIPVHTIHTQNLGMGKNIRKKSCQAAQGLFFLPTF